MGGNIVEDRANHEQDQFGVVMKKQQKQKEEEEKAEQLRQDKEAEKQRRKEEARKAKEEAYANEHWHEEGQAALPPDPAILFAGPKALEELEATQDAWDQGGSNWWDKDKGKEWWNGGDGGGDSSWTCDKNKDDSWWPAEGSWGENKPPTEQTDGWEESKSSRRKKDRTKDNGDKGKDGKGK